MFLVEPIKQKFIEKEQTLTLSDVTWEDYEALKSSKYKKYLISYLDNEITIMSPGRNHERITEIIKILIVAYCRKFSIACFPFGSTRLEEKGLEGKEPDCAYAFIQDKDSPDLAVEVNYTSGSIKDLTKYKYLKIKEVWLWENQTIKFYILNNNSYTEIDNSIHLPNVQSSKIINSINRGLTDDVIAIEKSFLLNL